MNFTGTLKMNYNKAKAQLALSIIRENWDGRKFGNPKGELYFDAIVAKYNDGHHLSVKQLIWLDKQLGYTDCSLRLLRQENLTVSHYKAARVIDTLFHAQ